MSKKNRIRFNLSKHDQKIQAREESEGREQAVVVMQKISRAFDQLQGRLTMKRKKGSTQAGTGVTPEDLKKFVADVEAMVEKECTAKELDSWRAMTLRLIRDKIELLRLIYQWNPEKKEFDIHNVFEPIESAQAGLAAGNEMMKELPQSMRPTQVRYTFKELGEFENLEDVRRAKMAEGFVCFVLELNRVLAVYDDGAFRVIGTVGTGVGLETIPSREQFVKAMKEKE